MDDGRYLSPEGEDAGADGGVDVDVLLAVPGGGADCATGLAFAVQFSHELYQRLGRAALRGAGCAHRGMP